MNVARGIWTRVPAALAFVLLLAQMALPWTARHFVTQDGPSHIYTAAVAADLLVYDDAPYSRVYRFSNGLATNWAMTTLAGVLTLFVDANHVERILWTICVAAGFFAFSYLAASLCGHAAWSPVIIFLVNTWFLWIGFYNFHIGMALCAAIAGYYVRHASSMNAPRSTVVCVALLLLFFTHVQPLCLALLTIVLVALWLHVVIPLARCRDMHACGSVLRSGVRPMVNVAVMVAPSVLLVGLFLLYSERPTGWDPEIASFWKVFPKHVFASGRSTIARGALLVPVMLTFALAGIVSMRKAEWASARGGVTLASIACLGLYLLAPDRGFGGSSIKMRFAWAAIVFGSVVALSASRMRLIVPMVSIYAAVLLTMHFMEARRDNIAHVSRAVDELSAVLNRIPENASVIRVGYRMRAMRSHFGFDTIAVEPLYHIDAWAAARQDFIDLTDYEALTGLFPIIVTPDLEPYRYALWGLEGVKDSGVPALPKLLSSLPARVDYVVVIGDPGAGDRDQLIAELRAQTDVVATDRAGFIWLFRRKAVPVAAGH